MLNQKLKTISKMLEDFHNDLCIYTGHGQSEIYLNSHNFKVLQEELNLKARTPIFSGKGIVVSYHPQGDLKICELKSEEVKPSGGYHSTPIAKGVLGKPSKIQEELDEVNDAIAQGSKIMVAVELADLYGALEAYAETQNLTMNDLKLMSSITKRAFQSGQRK